MCEVLSHLGIVPGMPTTPSAMEAVESWVELEDQEEVVKALAADAEAVLVEKMNDKLSEEPDSDEEEELNNTGEIESAGGRKLVAPPPYTELSAFVWPTRTVGTVGWKYRGRAFSSQGKDVVPRRPRGKTSTAGRHEDVS